MIGRRLAPAVAMAAADLASQIGSAAAEGVERGTHRAGRGGHGGAEGSWMEVTAERWV